MKFAAQFRRNSRPGPEHGYILLTLMMLATLVVITLAIALPELSQQIKRDREMELIHRGVQYSRAIQHFYKKTGRYPTRLEELDSFNNLRFLRKHYKDPITGQDFKILRFGDVRMSFGGNINGAVVPGSPAAGLAASNGRSGAFVQQSTFGQQGGAFASGGAFGSQGGGMNGQSAFGVQPTAQQQAANESSPDNQVSPRSNPTAAANGDPGEANSDVNPNQNGSGFSGQVFGGMPIVGVASTSNKKSIREFNKKNHYKDWQFIYDPSSDRGGLLNSPAQPQLNANQAGPGQGQGIAPGTQMPGAQMPGTANPNQPAGGFGSQGMPMPNQPPDQNAPEQ
jgi:type II secretory pathway pseudopilin PulG